MSRSPYDQACGALTSVAVLVAAGLALVALVGRDLLRDRRRLR